MKLVAFCALAAGASLAGASLGCAGADATTLAASSSPGPVRMAASSEIGLVPGESMSYEVRLGGLLAGEAALAVGELGTFEGRRAVVVKSRAATAGAAALVKHVVDEATTTIDMDSGRPIRLETNVELGDKKTTALARFTGSKAEVTYETGGKPTSYKLDFGTVTVHDTHSAMAQLRGWKGARGQTRTVFVVGGRRLWRIDVTYVGEESIGSAVGNRRAIRYDGASYRANGKLGVEPGKPSRTFTVWVSDDADRVPLKMSAKTELGEITMQLVEYNRSK
jgi:hypothetical protein